MTTRKTKALTRHYFVGKVVSLLFNLLSRLVITFLPRNKRLLISWLQSPSAVIFKLLKIKSVTVSIVSPSICHEVMGPDAIILVFWILSFKLTFSLSSFTFIKSFFSSSLSAIGWCHLHIWGYWYFSQQSWLQLMFHQVFITIFIVSHLPNVITFNGSLCLYFISSTINFPRIARVIFFKCNSHFVTYPFS